MYLAHARQARISTLLSVWLYKIGLVLVLLLLITCSLIEPYISLLLNKTSKQINTVSCFRIEVYLLRIEAEY